MPGHRSWIFTINNYTDQDVDELFMMNFKYMIIGFEIAPTTGTPHIQGYVQFYEQRLKRAVKHDIHRGHIKVAYGNFEDNIAYCSKDDVWFEYGIKPTKGGKVTYTQVEAAFADPENNMTIIRQYGKAFEYVKQQRIVKSDVKTKYYVIKPEFDAITEIIEYLGEINIVVIQNISELAAYDSDDFSDKSIILLFPYLDYIIPLYPRGIPLKYKYGYEYRTAKPKHFIVVTDTASLGRLTGYKKIK